VQPSPSSKDSNIQLADQGELPHDATLSFAVRTQWPTALSRDQTIEVATADESSSTVLSFANGGLTLENAQVAVATLNPAQAFGASAFGPLQFRVTAKGVMGDWQPLGNLVRLPLLKVLTCPATPELACKLSGSSLFLIHSVANDREFTHPVQVPDGFLGAALPVPHPTGGTLFVKLRDDPTAVNPITLTAQQLPPSPKDQARAAAAQPPPATENSPVAPTPAVPMSAAPLPAAPVPATPAPAAQTPAAPTPPATNFVAPQLSNGVASAAESNHATNP